MISVEVRKRLLENGLVIFSSDYGKKGVAESWTLRLNKQIKKLEQFKEYQNINLITGQDLGIVDSDLDCKEARLLADEFLTPTNMEFGRESTPRAHRIYKVIDLTKKHTRKYFEFKGIAKDKSVIAEIRANKHYTMCGGQYDNGESCTWTKYGNPVEINWDTLHKQLALLSVASVILHKWTAPGSHDEYIRLMINTLWYHKISQEDCESIIRAVLKHCPCKKCNTETLEMDDNKLLKVKTTYSKDRNEQLEGLPKLAEKFNWTEDEIKDFKKLLLKITGRDILPAFTNEFVQRIAYMMKQKKYYDLEDKEVYDAEAIDVKYSKHFDGRYTPLKYWKQHKDSKVCVDFAYQPGDPNRFVTVGKKLMINVFEKNEIVPDSKADTDLYDALVEHVIPHDEYRKHFLDWCAYHVQNPGKKIRHAILLQSDEFQLGKGSLFDMQRDILGRGNTNKIDLKEALDKGKGYLINKQCVLIDEAKASGSWNEKNMFLNTLKTLITEGTAGIRQLYKDYSEQDTCTNYWINTNYRDAFPLPYNEVRYFVYFCPNKRNEKLLDEFHEARLEGSLVRGVLAKFLDRDLSNFKPLGVAPETPYLHEMRKMADRPIADYISEQFKQGVAPFDRDVMSVVETFNYLCDNTKIRITRNREIADAFKGLGGKLFKSCPVKDVGKFVNLWVLRKHNKYKNMTAAELGKSYVPFYTDIGSKR